MAQYSYNGPNCPCVHVTDKNNGEWFLIKNVVRHNEFQEGVDIKVECLDGESFILNTNYQIVSLER